MIIKQKCNLFFFFFENWLTIFKYSTYKNTIKEIVKKQVELKKKKIKIYQMSGFFNSGE